MCKLYLIYRRLLVIYARLVKPRNDLTMKEYILCKALQLHFKNKKQYYKTLGYDITYDKKTFKVTYNNSSNYTISIDTENKTKYLKLSPYHKSYFKTELSLKELKFKVDMTLFALKENEEIHKQ